MANLDSQGNLHARDGKFTHKAAGIDNDATKLLDNKRPGASSFYIPAVQDFSSTLPNEGYDLPDFPARLPEPAVEFGYDEQSKLYMCVQNSEDPDQMVFVTENDEGDCTVDTDDYFEGASDAEKEQFQQWTWVAFKRGELTAIKQKEASVPPGYFAHLANFAAGVESAEAEEGETHRERHASRMQHALSGYLPADHDDPESAATGLADVLTNLRHYAQVHGLDFDEATDRSLGGQFADDEEDGLR